jgi:hypothetical protein
MACYKFSSCTAGNTTILWSTDPAWAPYVGGPAISFSNQGGNTVAYTVELIEDPCTSCQPNNPLVNTSFLIASLGCNSPNSCYKLTECNNSIAPVYVSNNLNPYIGLSIAVAEYPGYCFNVTGVVNPVECDANLPNIEVTCVNLCTCNLFCYELTNCLVADTIIVHTSLTLTLNTVIAINPAVIAPGGNNCWTVTDLYVQPCDINTGVLVTSIIPYGPNGCAACGTPPPCYTLADCSGTILPFNTNSNLAAYIGQVVHLTEYSGCAGPCFLVSLNTGPCPVVQAVTVTIGCVPCPPCNQTCYQLIDCQTRIPYAILSSPTANGVDLSLLVGQSIGKVCLSPEPVECTTGCWEVQIANTCGGAISAYVYNIYDDCAGCLNSCYSVQNCQTGAIDYIIKYTIPNPNGLPNPNTIVGAVGDLCFIAPTGCVTGCYQLQLIPGASCVGSIDWSTVVSYTPYNDCFSCLPKCYLLTECAPAVSAPIVVNNDLSLYVGQVAKICDSLGECHCYNVEISQSCTSAITIDNANASFTTCEECNSCECPPGYTKVGEFCQKITTIPAVANPTIYSTGPGSLNTTFYGILGTNFYGNISALPFPLTAVTGPDRFQDAAAVTVPSVNNIIGVWGPGVGSRLNSVGVWTTVNPNPLSQWIGFTECITIPTTGIYCIGIGGDDAVRIKIDGVLVAIASIGLFDFQYWHVFEISLTAGTHIITLEGFNTGGNTAFAAEIYNVTSAVLQTYTTSVQVQLATIFSTFPKRISGTFQTGETSGYSCPPGYALDSCGDKLVCSLIETIPYVECAPTYLVTSCEPGVEPFLTNTDLSAYIGSTYKACITNPTYSTTCFILKDCNRLVPDIVTNTNLTTSLWQIVNVDGYPGSCFIVTGVPVGNPCIAPITVVASLPVIGACDCPGAQVPWPNGCYCVTVEEVASEVAIDFLGVFSTAYNVCEDCLQVCYVLTDCNNALDPVTVCNDLEEYLGQVIKIEGCGDICWQVTLALNCDSSLAIPGKITLYEDCEACLPPLPPVPPPYDLHLRKIKPGWKSPNKCYTLDYIERINCSFGQQIYNEMLVARYGITMCCEEDVNKWDIKKQMLDLDMLKDPNLCKSTLCCCPAPCFIEAFVTVLPFCGAPNIVSVILDLPCPTPVLIDVEIEVLIEPAVCYCWSVGYDIAQPPLVISYIDCCCVPQTQVIDVSGEGSIPICSTTAPVSFGDPIVVTNQGLCGVANICNPPPFQACSCWQIYNPTLTTLGFTIDAICPSGPLPIGQVGTIAPGLSVYNCSIAPPVVDAGLVVINNGDCGTYCGPIPAVCVCYIIEATEPCTVDYTDCLGRPVVGYNILVGTNYICGNSMPIADATCSQFITIGATAADCSLGECEAPVIPCICYELTVPFDGFVHDVDIVDCTGVPVQISYAVGGKYYICSQSLPVSDPSVLVAATGFGCGPGQCVAP